MSFLTLKDLSFLLRVEVLFYQSLHDVHTPTMSEQSTCSTCWLGAGKEALFLPLTPQYNNFFVLDILDSNDLWANPDLRLDLVFTLC